MHRVAYCTTTYHIMEYDVGVYCCVAVSPYVVTVLYHGVLHHIMSSCHQQLRGECNFGAPRACTGKGQATNSVGPKRARPLAVARRRAFLIYTSLIYIYICVRMMCLLHVMHARMHTCMRVCIHKKAIACISRNGSWRGMAHHAWRANLELPWQYPAIPLKCYGDTLQVFAVRISAFTFLLQANTCHYLCSYGPSLH